MRNLEAQLKRKEKRMAAVEIELEEKLRILIWRLKMRILRKLTRMKV